MTMDKIITICVPETTENRKVTKMTIQKLYICTTPDFLSWNQQYKDHWKTEKTKYLGRFQPFKLTYELECSRWQIYCQYK